MSVLGEGWYVGVFPLSYRDETDDESMSNTHMTQLKKTTGQTVSQRREEGWRVETGNHIKRCKKIYVTKESEEESYLANLMQNLQSVGASPPFVVVQEKNVNQVFLRRTLPWPTLHTPTIKQTSHQRTTLAFH